VTVVATNTIWADVATVIVGDEGSVTSLMPVGADPHDFQPSASQISDMFGADLVVANGLGLEQGLDAVLESADGDGANILELGPLLMPVDRVDRLTCDTDASHDHGEAAACDPHVWMDPDRVVLAAAAIAQALTAIDPDGGWQVRAEAYIAEVEALATEMEGTLDSVDPDRRLLVTNHDSLGYLAERFDFDVVATVIPGGSTLANPSSADLANLVATMRELHIEVIFAETSDSTALADAVAGELGGSVTVVELYSGSLGGPGSGAETVIDMLRTDASLIAGSLS
jgi:zinc/manganese transport system substrate-binding protein